MGKIRNHAFGMHIFAIASYQKEKEQSKVQSIDLFFYQNNKILNTYLNAYTKKRFNVNFIYKYLYLSNLKVFGYQKHLVEINHDDFDGIFIDNYYKFSFNEYEDKVGYNFLKKIGFDHNDKIICLIVRDSNYKNNIFPKFDWNYHNFRNCKIDDFNQTIKYLIEKGYKVLRMGKFVSEKSSFKNSNFFDYASSSLRTDFLDLWLMSKCFFCISTGTGTDNLALVSNIPTIFVNYLPLTSIPTFSKCLIAPKMLFWKKNNNKFKIEDYLSNSYKKSSDYIKNGIVFKSLSEKQILDCVKEMEMVTNNQFDLELYKSDEYKNIHEKVKKYLYNEKKIKKMHKESRISYNFSKSFLFKKFI